MFRSVVKAGICQDHGSVTINWTKVRVSVTTIKGTMFRSVVQYLNYKMDYVQVHG